jgi:hypothetical protein
MSVRLGPSKSLADFSIGGSSSLVGGEVGTLECQHLRVGIVFTLPLMTMENHVVVTDFEGAFCIARCACP